MSSSVSQTNQATDPCNAITHVPRRLSHWIDSRTLDGWPAMEHYLAQQVRQLSEHHTDQTLYVIGDYRFAHRMNRLLFQAGPAPEQVRVHWQRRPALEPLHVSKFVRRVICETNTGHRPGPGDMIIWSGAWVAPICDALQSHEPGNTGMPDIRVVICAESEAHAVRCMAPSASCVEAWYVPNDHVKAVLSDALSERDFARIKRVAMKLDTPIEPNRKRLREHWGVSPQTLVVAMVGDPPSEADAFMGVWAVGLAGETGRDIRLICASDAAGVEDAKQITTSMGRSERLMLEPRMDQFWQVAAGCDVALLGHMTAEHFHQNPGRFSTGGTGGPISLLAARAGLAILMEHDEPAVGWPMHDAAGQSACPGILIVPTAYPRALAQQLCRLHDEPAWREQLGQANARWHGESIGPMAGLTELLLDAAR